VTMNNLARALTIFLLSGVVAGFGTAVPDIKEFWDRDKPPAPGAPVGVPGAAQMEWEIKKRIFCDLKEAVKAANSIPFKSGTPNRLTVKRPGLIPVNWGAQISSSLQVDETSSLNPVLTLNTTYPAVISYPATKTALGAISAVTTPQSFGLGFGATLSSTATRTDKFDPYYTIETLMREDSPNSICWGGPPYTQNDPLLEDGWVPVAAGKAANLVGERPLPSIARIRTASISDARGGNKPCCART
jgi:hypothetical protein